MPHPPMSPKDRREIEALIERLEQYKIQGEFSDVEIGRAARVGQTSVSAWFREKNAPLGHILARLPRALSRPGRKVNGHYLLTGEGEMYLSEEGETGSDAFQRGKFVMLAELEEAMGRVRRKLLDQEPVTRRKR